ncbi:MAG: hypothetical protein JNJ45_11830 [Chthonomonas sp.]|nr:hypothetical protein [Chthonomonas sp.]
MDCNADFVTQLLPVYELEMQFCKHEPMAGSWSVPDLTINTRRVRKADTVSWMLEAPVVSERAFQLLRHLIEPSAEVLPLPDISGSKYFALNVLHQQSDIRIAVQHGSPVEFPRLSSEFHDGAGISQVPLGCNTPVVTSEFVEVVIANHLTGFTFPNHQTPKLRSILREAICTMRPDALFMPKGSKGLITRPLLDEPKLKVYQKYWAYMEGQGILLRDMFV